MNRKSCYGLCLLMSFVVGCSLAPKYEPPAMPVPASWPQGLIQETEEVRAQRIKWKEFISDERLQRVVEMALKNSRDMKVAALNVERVRAMYRIQRAELLPVIEASAGMVKERVPGDLSTLGKATNNSQFDMNVGLTAWEIDFFGRIRNLSEKALQEYLGTEQARRGMMNTIIAAVADAYLTLAGDLEQLKLSTTTYETQKESYRLIKRKWEVGTASELDLRRAETMMESARVDVARYTQVVDQDRNALNLLVGSTVPEELMPGELATVIPMREFSAGIFSDVLLKRPDVLQAEHTLRGAHANIGAARAAFFPRIVLTTSAGTASEDLSGLFRHGSGTWAFAPRITVPIFDARTWAAYDVAKVEREIALAEYERAIQTAFREVADALAVKKYIDQQIDAQTALVQASLKTYQLSQRRFEQGIDSFLSVLDAHRFLLADERVLIGLRLMKSANLVGLYKALGGHED